jgi:hypothetical protein
MEIGQVRHTDMIELIGVRSWPDKPAKLDPGGGHSASA